MRLPLIVLAAGLTASCSSLDKTPGEAGDDLGSWFNSLFDAHITVGDIITYIIAGVIILVLIGLAAND